MNNFRRLIVPVDGSAAANRGITFAAQLAQREAAVVDVCSVVNDVAVMASLAEGAMANPGPLLEYLETAGTTLIGVSLASLHDAGIAGQGIVLHGNPLDEIHEFARRQRADAIVIGTNGRSGMDRLFMGSLTYALVRIADIPVVTVHADDTLLAGPMLVAIDASAASQAALACAIDRALVSGVALALLHVFEQSDVDRLSVAMGRRQHSARRQALTAAEDALDDAADRVRAAGVRFTTHLERGVPADVIVLAAERQGAGSIVIGTHGRGPLQRFVLGSVADGVIRAARVPVYVVHRRDVRVSQDRAMANDPAAHATVPR